MELSFYLFIFITSQIMINKHNEQETDNYCLYIKIKKLFYGTSSDVIPNCVTYTCGACLGFSGLSKNSGDSNVFSLFTSEFVQ